AAIPGAVVGGRIGYALIHLDYYRANPAALVDPGKGSLELGLAVVGATLSAGLVARILDRGPGVWLHVAALPLLGTLGIGKIAAALGGSGQGSFGDAPIATVYLRPGPWGSLGADMAAWPSQLIEGLLVLTLVVVLVVSAVAFESRDHGQGRGSPDSRDRLDGRDFFLALGLWALVRFAVAFTWRDARVVGPLDVDQLISLAIVIGSAAAYRLVSRRATRDGSPLLA
ncbi:MAG TPA: prolipoprotein diacylglyceryl transferase family protein, partial [Candidatus Limnocylindrales bacterium]